MNRQAYMGAVLAMALGAGTTAFAREMSVQLRNGALKSRPEIFAPVVGQVAYGDRVNVVEGRNGWSRVEFGELSGWLHDSVLTRKVIVAKTGSADVGRTVSSDELSLAGKGFNAQVEAEFKARNPEADFALVDRVEKMAVDPLEIQKFFDKGAVRPQGGAQ